MTLPLESLDAEEYGTLIARTREQRGEAAWSQGEGLTLGQATAEADAMLAAAARDNNENRNAL